MCDRERERERGDESRCVVVTTMKVMVKKMMKKRGRPWNGGDEAARMWLVVMMVRGGGGHWCVWNEVLAVAGEAAVAETRRTSVKEVK